ncbi:AKT-interacting protein [Liparis tanakae]|uniref:AKT-interacting protein n=1 Tax=Liparis tanakae TaxID=230148 RepID=A0A4Z2FYU6_9TELE|nr:AKT-interacting protein [Liparis tanakae]
MNLNPFWSMSANTSRKQRTDGEDQSGPGEPRASPARLSFGKKQLPPIPKNATPVTKPASTGAPAPSANGTHASRNHNHIWQVLMYARTVFYKINTTEPLNPEAAVLYEKDVQLFKSKVVDSVKLCNSHLFDQPKMEDPYAISFSPWNPAVHDEAKERMFTCKRRPDDHHKGSQVSGLSWVKPGSTQPFSKEDGPPPS